MRFLRVAFVIFVTYSSGFSFSRSSARRWANSLIIGHSWSGRMGITTCSPFPPVLLRKLASDSLSVSDGGTDWSAGGEHGPASPSRVGPGIGVVKLALFALLAVTLALLAAVLRHAGETSRAGNSQSPIEIGRANV